MARLFVMSLVAGLAVASASAQAPQPPAKTSLPSSNIQPTPIRGSISGRGISNLVPDILASVDESTSIRVVKLASPEEPNKPLRGQKGPELTSLISRSFVIKRGPNDPPLINDGTSGTLIFADEGFSTAFSTSRVVINPGPNDPAPTSGMVRVIGPNDPVGLGLATGATIIKLGANHRFTTVTSEEVSGFTFIRPSPNEPAKKFSIVDFERASMGLRLDKNPNQPPSQALDSHIVLAVDLLREQKERRLVEEQKLTATVEKVIRAAGKLKNNPESAVDMLKETLLRIQDHPELSEQLRDALSTRLRHAIGESVLQGRTNQTLDPRIVRAISDFLAAGGSKNQHIPMRINKVKSEEQEAFFAELMRIHELSVPQKPNEPLRGQKPTELPRPGSSLFIRRGPNDPPLIIDGTAGTLLGGERVFSPAEALLINEIVGVTPPVKPNEPLRGQKPKPLDSLEELVKLSGFTTAIPITQKSTDLRSFFGTVRVTGPNDPVDFTISGLSSTFTKLGANHRITTVINEPDSGVTFIRRKPNDPLIPVTIVDFGANSIELTLKETHLRALRKSVGIHLQRGSEEALPELEELIAELTKQRDRLSKEHQQQPARLAELETTKAELGRAHLEFGLLSQVAQGRREVLRLEEEIRAGRSSAEDLARAREKLALSEKRLAETRGK